MKLRQIDWSKPYLKPTIVGFMAIYILCILLSTYLVKEKYEEEYDQMLKEAMETIQESFDEMDSEIAEQSRDDSDYFANYVNMLVSYDLEMESYNQISAAVYNYYGKKIAQTTVVMGFQYIPQYAINETERYTGNEDFYFDLREYLTEEEISEVMKLYYEDISSAAIRYSAQAYIHEETGELSQIKIYTLKDGKYAVKEVWSWKNPNIEEYDPMLITPRNGAFDLIIPSGYEYYNEWKKNAYLQEYVEQIELLAGYKNVKPVGEVPYINIASSVLEGDWLGVSRLFHEDGEGTFIILIRQTSYPWLAAIAYLKYVYLAGFILMIVCMIKVIWRVKETYEQREALEETRKDFTNAIAHELKTPLGIIRGFAENLKENTMEDKRDYYLDQIVGQTEEMDKMVQEMIYISKLDSGQLVLKKERISMRNLIEEQVDKLGVAAEKKNLEICYQSQEDFIFEGDKYYLEKAVWNLVENAVEYNHQDGIINISINEKECSIENTGISIAEEDLPHVFDMFYTGNKSRNSREKHMGLGLYLAKKIFEMHDLVLKIENTKTGVKVIITK